MVLVSGQHHGVWILLQHRRVLVGYVSRCLSAQLSDGDRAFVVGIVLHGPMMIFDHHWALGQPHNGYIWAARIMIDAKLTAAQIGGSVRGLR
jgi:hypothetical protein